MPIPNFSIDGILPPFIGRLGPGDTMEDMSPYAVSALEVVTTLGGTEQRKSVLRGWLQHRAALRGAGYGRGFQWLDGSFVEAKEPKDIDVVAFLYRPGGIIAANELAKSMEANIELFDRDQVKVAFHVDFFPIDLDGPVETTVRMTRYMLGLFSHRREDYIWKGMLQVRLEDVTDDAAALGVLGSEPIANAGGSEP